MKSLFLLLVWGIVFPVWAQTEKPLLFKDTLCVHTESPLLLMKGMEVTIGCDSAYLINPQRYALYQRLHRHIQEVSVEGDCRPLLETYEKALLEAQGAYENLHRQYRLTDRLAVQWLQESAQSVAHMQQSLQQAEQTVMQASQHMTEVGQMVRQQQRRNTMTKALIGLGGAGFGLLIGALLMQ